MFEDAFDDLQEVKVYCDFCGTPMYVYEYEAASEKPLYCSTDCEDEAYFDQYDESGFYYDDF